MIRHTHGIQQNGIYMKIWYAMLTIRSNRKMPEDVAKSYRKLNWQLGQVTAYWQSSLMIGLMYTFLLQSTGIQE